jgi:hypothetical protein
MGTTKYTYHTNTTTTTRPGLFLIARLQYQPIENHDWLAMTTTTTTTTSSSSSTKDKPAPPQQRRQDDGCRRRSGNSNSCGGLVPVVVCPVVVVPSTLHYGWVAATALCVWFLLYHAPRVLRERDSRIAPLLWVHLVGAYGIYMGCVHNALLTPSVVGAAWHKWVGRVALVLGIVGFTAAFVYTWWWWSDVNQNLPFAIGVTMGGIAQISSQYLGYVHIKEYQRYRDLLLLLEQESGVVVAAAAAVPNNANGTTRATSVRDEKAAVYRAARDVALEKHVANMISLLLLACGIPALVRLAESSHHLPLTLPLLIGASIVIAQQYVRFFHRKIHRRHTTAPRPRIAADDDDDDSDDGGGATDGELDQLQPDKNNNICCGSMFLLILYL